MKNNSRTDTRIVNGKITYERESLTSSNETWFDTRANPRAMRLSFHIFRRLKTTSLSAVRQKHSLEDQSALGAQRPDQKEIALGAAPAVEPRDVVVLAIQVEPHPVVNQKAGKDPGQIPEVLRATTVASRDTFPENVGPKEAGKMKVLVTIIRRKTRGPSDTCRCGAGTGYPKRRGPVN
jgi:hypothetical protein